DPVWVGAAAAVAAAGLTALLERTPSRLGGSPLLLAYGLFVGAGAFLAAAAPTVIHPAGAAVLALGVGVAAGRRLRGAEARLTERLRRRLALIPLLLLAAGLGAYGAGRIRESWLARRLPPPPERAANALVIVLDTVRS